MSFIVVLVTNYSKPGAYIVDVAVEGKTTKTDEHGIALIPVEPGTYNVTVNFYGISNGKTLEVPNGGTPEQPTFVSCHFNFEEMSGT